VQKKKLRNLRDRAIEEAMHHRKINYREWEGGKWKLDIGGYGEPLTFTPIDSKSLEKEVDFVKGLQDLEQLGEGPKVLKTPTKEKTGTLKTLHNIPLHISNKGRPFGVKQQVPHQEGQEIMVKQISIRAQRNKMGRIAHI